MQACEAKKCQLVGAKEMVEIASAVAFAGVARTASLDGFVVADKFSASNIEFPAFCEKSAVASVASRHHAVKHIHAAPHALD